MTRRTPAADRFIQKMRQYGRYPDYRNVPEIRVLAIKHGNAHRLKKNPLPKA